MWWGEDTFILQNNSNKKTKLSKKEIPSILSQFENIQLFFLRCDMAY